MLNNKENIASENNILYVIKMLTHEKNWCHHITFDYDYQDNELICLSFFIGPIKFFGYVIRNSPQNYQNKNFLVPLKNDTLLKLPNSFYIFINDEDYIGQCIMILNNKIYEYKESHPKINSNYIIVDKDYIYKNKFWISILPSNEDKMLLYPELYMYLGHK